MADVRIYNMGSLSPQQGKYGADDWYLEFEPREGLRPDPLMGWAGSSDTERQVRLRFPTLERALAYCQRENLVPHVVPRPKVRLLLQSYADNFR